MGALRRYRLLQIVAVTLGVLGVGAGAPALSRTPDSRLSLLPGPAPPQTSAPEPVSPPEARPTPAADPAPADPADQRCFGAPSGDRNRPCYNPALDYTVVPAPDGAREAQVYLPCTKTVSTTLFKACYWGAAAKTASRTVALLGDSHASHLRAAMQDVVGAENWRGVSIQKAGCPLTDAHPNLPGRARQADCMRWNRGVQRWLRARPEIDTVFVSAHLAAALATRQGQTASQARRQGYRSAWRQLLRGSVKHIVVFRDTPRNSRTTIPCVERAVADHVRLPGRACALERSYALRPDPLAQEAKALKSPAVQTVNLANLMCDHKRCHPVVGGVLVLRDTTHLTTAFSASLGPYLLGQVRRISARWAPSAHAAG